MSALLARGASSSLAAQGLKATRGQKSVSAAPLAPSRPSRGSTIRTHALLDFLKPKTKTKRETVVLEPSYNLQAGLAAIAGLEAYQGWIPVAAFTGFIAAFLTFQATRLSFVFDDEALEIKKSGEDTDNVLVGGRNRWPYESFINWEFWWPAFPVLVYFKVHFFPIIFNGKQLYEVMKERCGPSQNSA